MERRVAFVTGASRGIGKATALALAREGFELVLTARTVREGERYEHSSTVKASDTSAQPGSLEITAQQVAELGAKAHVVCMDLLDPESIGQAAAEGQKRCGRVDVLVNNAVYTGPGNMDRVTDLPLDVTERILRANVVSQLQLTQLLLPGMLERGRGTVVNVTSHAATVDPRSPVGSGGWGFAYAASKAAFHRLAGILAVELKGSGIRTHNLDPGFVMTEMMELQHRDQQGFQANLGAPPAVPAAVIAWLATADEAQEWDGATLHAQPFCKEHRLVPDWP